MHINHIVLNNPLVINGPKIIEQCVPRLVQQYYFELMKLN